MQYSLTANITNSGTGTRQLTEVELRSLTDGTTASGIIDMAASETIRITGELSNRYNLSSLKYYHSAGGTVSVSVSESHGLWYDLPTVVEAWGTSVDLQTYYPRWVKIEHSSGTSTPSIHEVEIYNGDGEILFGPSGQFDSYGLDSSGIIVQAVQIYNNSYEARDVNIFVENTPNSDADDLLTVGLTSSGIFYGKRERGLNFPDDFSWDSGQHNSTETTVSGHLTLSGTTTSGTYYSPVFSMSPYEDNRFYWEWDGNGYVDYVFSLDSEDCFGVRQFYIPPSGTWSSGQLADESDYYWSISSGALDFQPIPDDTILELRDREYIQFSVTLSGSIAPHVYKTGIESPLTVSGIQPGSYKEVYITSSSGTTSGNQTALICWYKE